MEDIIKKLNKVLESILKERDVVLFAVIKREDAELWDIVISGNQLDNQENLRWIIGLINNVLEKNEMTAFSRLLLLNTDEDFVKNLTKTFGFTTKDGRMELKNVRINNIFIKHAYLLRSRTK